MSLGTIKTAAEYICKTPVRVYNDMFNKKVHARLLDCVMRNLCKPISICMCVIECARLLSITRCAQSPCVAFVVRMQLARWRWLGRSAGAFTAFALSRLHERATHAHARCNLVVLLARCTPSLRTQHVSIKQFITIFTNGLLIVEATVPHSTAALCPKEARNSASRCRL